MATSPRFTEEIYPTPTYSRGASPAKTSARQESEPGLKALAAAFGLSSPVSLGRLDPDTSSLRTSQGCLFTTECEELSESFPDSGMWGYGDVYELQSSAPVTLESESSLWPTAVAKDDGKTPESHLAMKQRMGERDGTFANRTAITSLAVKVQTWPTPNTKDSASAARHTTTTGIMHPGTTLTDAIRLWPTPTEDNANNADGPSRTKGTYSDLTVEVSHWTTPQAHDGMGGPRTAEQLELAKALNKGGNCNLSTDAALWQTPGTDSFRSRGGDRKDEMGLDQQARTMFPTPSSRDWKSEVGIENRQEHHSPTLSAFVYLNSLPDPQIPDGPISSPPDRTSHRLWPTAQESMAVGGFPRTTPATYGGMYRGNAMLAAAVEFQKKTCGPGPEKRRLNPRFVSWLMGFPVTWTEI